MPTTASFKDMPIWQRAMGLVIEVYKLTSILPTTERLGLSTSLQQASIKVPTEIASGTRAGRKGLQSACLSARASCAEVETLLFIIQQAYPNVSVDELLNEVNDIQTALLGMAKRLEGGSSNSQKPRTV